MKGKSRRDSRRRPFITSPRPSSPSSCYGTSSTVSHHEVTLHVLGCCGDGGRGDDDGAAQRGRVNRRYTRASMCNLSAIVLVVMLGLTFVLFYASLGMTNSPESFVSRLRGGLAGSDGGGGGLVVASVQHFDMDYISMPPSVSSSAQATTDLAKAQRLNRLSNRLVAALRELAAYPVAPQNEASLDATLRERYQFSVRNEEAVEALEGRLLRAIVDREKELRVVSVGGSITVGNGLTDSRSYAYSFVDWLSGAVVAAKQTFFLEKHPPTTSADRVSRRPRTKVPTGLATGIGGARLANAALGATGSEYFAYCLRHLVDLEATDIVIGEFAVNDDRSYYMPGYQPDIGRPMEEFIRQVLGSSTDGNRISLLLANFFFGKKLLLPDGPDCHSIEDETFDHLADVYRVPAVSWKRAICDYKHLAQPTNDDVNGSLKPRVKNSGVGGDVNMSALFEVSPANEHFVRFLSRDQTHPSPLGHDLMSLYLSTLVRRAADSLAEKLKFDAKRRRFTVLKTHLGASADDVLDAVSAKATGRRRERERRSAVGGRRQRLPVKVFPSTRLATARDATRCYTTFERPFADDDSLMRNLQAEAQVQRTIFKVTKMHIRDQYKVLLIRNFGSFAEFRLPVAPCPKASVLGSASSKASCTLDISLVYTLCKSCASGRIKAELSVDEGEVLTGGSGGGALHGPARKHVAWLPLASYGYKTNIVQPINFAEADGSKLLVAPRKSVTLRLEKWDDDFLLMLLSVVTAWRRFDGPSEPRFATMTSTTMT